MRVEQAIRRVRLAKPTRRDVDVLLQLYQIYDRHRDALIWLLSEMDAKDYAEFRKKYSSSSKERVYFTSVCGFFELSGVLVNRGLLDEDLYFDTFNVAPFWERAKAIVYGMRKERPRIYENFELLYNRRIVWAKGHPPKVKAPGQEGSY